MSNKITARDLESILGFAIDNNVSAKIDQFDLRYEDLTSEEMERYLIHVVDVLTSEIVKSGAHRIDDWEKGWGENLEMYRQSKDINSLIPKYHCKNRYVRWMGKVVNPTTPAFDYKIHISFIDAILHHYLNHGYGSVYEFGCGPGYHLLRLRESRSDLDLVGLDWARSSQELISEISKSLTKKIECHNFDFFKPNYDISINPNSMVYTVAALEQTGANYVKFVDYLLDQKPSLCINMEPIAELLDESRLIDNLSIKYFRKRNYLHEYLTHLEWLEKIGKVKILDKRRIYSGSYFIEGHSLVVWRPI
jgi:hypothetical protein